MTKRRYPSTEELLAQYADPNRPHACDDCGRRPVPSRFADGGWVDAHSGSCPQNSALQVCERCGYRHVDRDFGQVLACVMDVPLDEGREMQKRIVNRVASAVGVEPGRTETVTGQTGSEADDNGSSGERP